jgi:hypothetical protein
MLMHQPLQYFYGSFRVAFGYGRHRSSAIRVVSKESRKSCRSDNQFSFLLCRLPSIFTLSMRYFAVANSQSPVLVVFPRCSLDPYDSGMGASTASSVRTALKRAQLTSSKIPRISGQDTNAERECRGSAEVDKLTPRRRE